MAQVQRDRKPLLMPFFGLTLLACAQAPESACIVSPDKVLLEMRQNGIEPEKNLEGQAAVDLRNYLESHGNLVPKDVDQVILFVKDEAAMIAFFWHGCLTGDITGPFKVNEPSARST